MRRAGWIAVLVAAVGLLGFVVFQLSTLRVTPPAVDRTTLKIDTVMKSCALPAGDKSGAPVEVGPCVGRPTQALPNATVPIFKVVLDGDQVQRVNVKFGRASADSVEILHGLKPGDLIVTSDMSAWDQFDRLRIR